MPTGVRIAQKDIGLGVILLGASYSIAIVNPLNWIGIILGLVAVILLLYRRHDLGIRQGYTLYSSIIIYVLSFIVFIVYFVSVAFSIASSVISQGYTGGSLPPSAIDSLLQAVLYSGTILVVVQAFCFFIIPYYMANRRLQFTLIGAVLVSIGVKILELNLSVNQFANLSNVSLSNALSIARGAPYTMPYIAISAVSTLSLGLVIVYIGNLVRTGRLNKLPVEGELTF